MAENTNNRSLVRSKTNRMFLGVAGGLGEYLNVDATIIRLVFIVLSLGAGGGLLLYLVLAIIMPDENGEDMEINKEKLNKAGVEMGNRIRETTKSRGKNNGGSGARLWLGLIIVILGLSGLLQELFPFWRVELTGPLLMIGLGLFLVLKN